MLSFTTLHRLDTIALSSIRSKRFWDPSSKDISRDTTMIKESKEADTTNKAKAITNNALTHQVTLFFREVVSSVVESLLISSEARSSAAVSSSIFFSSFKSSSVSGSSFNSFTIFSATSVTVVSSSDTSATSFDASVTSSISFTFVLSNKFTLLTFEVYRHRKSQRYRYC